MLNLNYIAKIEGHGKLNIDFKKHKAKLIVDEGERYFEALVLNRPFYDIPFIVSRICGVCPTAHYLASLKALENAFKITPPESSIILRKILLLGQIAQSHILHTVFLALPDYLNIDNIQDIAQKAPAEFSSALKIKHISDKVVEIIGGRAVHPITPIVGGFTKFPDKNTLSALCDELKKNQPHALNLVRFFAKLKYPNLTNQTQYLSLENDNEYAFYEGKVMSNNGFGFNPDKYKECIKEFVRFNSPAKFAQHSNKNFMVGALSRIFLHPHQLNLSAKNELDSYYENKNFPSCNPFHNNFAQAIEILHCFEEIINLLNRIIKEGLGNSTKKFEVRSGEGVGAIEAPRGTLYHYYKIDRFGTITDCDIITPTVQNLLNLENDAEKLMEETKSLSDKKRQKLIEMLIRAYDPCITCSVH